MQAFFINTDKPAGHADSQGESNDCRKPADQITGTGSAVGLLKRENQHHTNPEIPER